MSSSRSLLHSTAVYSTSNILNAAIPFLMLPVLTRMLPPSGYGVIAMYSAVFGVVSAFTGLNVDGAVNVRIVDQEKTDFPRYVGSCLWVLLGSSLATLALVFLFSAPIGRLTSLPTFWLLMVVLAAACNFLCNVRLGIWLMGRKPAAYGAFQVSLSAANMGLTLVFVLWLRQGYEGRLWGQTAAMGLFALIGLVSLARGGLVRLLPRWEYVRDALAFGVPLVPHAVGACLMGLADRFIINQKLGLAEAGIYMIAVQLGMGMTVLSDAFNKAFVPWLYAQLKLDGPEAKRRIVRGTWLYFLMALGLAALIALLSHWIVLFVAGAKYQGAAGALAWQALGQAFFGMYLMVTNYIFYARRTRPLALVTLLSGGGGLALTWLLVPLLGITGAGMSFACAMMVRFLMTWALAQRVCPMPWFESGITEKPALNAE